MQETRTDPLPSKYPSKYRIDLHVDDDITVYQNGKVYGFKVFILKNDDLDWNNKLLEEIITLNNKLNQ